MRYCLTTLCESTICYLYRGLSQYDVAEKLGTTQSAVSQWESIDSEPQKKTREQLAILYQCRPEQMIL